MPSRHEEPTELTWEDIPRLMDELQELATQLLRRWPNTGSLQPTLLVNTALRRQRRHDQLWEDVSWDNRGQLFGQVFRAMRQKLVEHRRHQQTRGYQSQRRVSVTDLDDYNAWRSWAEDPDLAAALQVGLEQLSQSEATAELARVVEYRFFAGLTWPQAAEMLGCSRATATRHWRRARLLIEDAIREQLHTKALALECSASRVRGCEDSDSSGHSE